MNYPLLYMMLLTIEYILQISTPKIQGNIPLLKLTTIVSSLAGIVILYFGDFFTVFGFWQIVYIFVTIIGSIISTSQSPEQYLKNKSNSVLFAALCVLMAIVTFGGFFS